jgi:hypothetical protein
VDFNYYIFDAERKTKIFRWKLINTFSTAFIGSNFQLAIKIVIEIPFFRINNGNLLFFLRISVIFRIRSAKAVKITDGSLIKKLGLLCGFVGVALLVRTLVAPPVVIVGRTADNLKAFLCKTDWWDHTFTSSEYH